MTNNTEQFGADIVGAVRDLLQRTLTPIVARLKVVESRTPEPGAKGEKGDAGEPGEKGADAQPVDVDQLIATALARVPVQKGEKGEKGEPGLPGAAQKGDKGDRGDQGDIGEPGRDAVHVDVLDGIEAHKRYQRGTFAAHRGGIVRSFRATDPLPADPLDLGKAGWHTVVRGIAEFDIALADDQRTVTVRAAYTDGQVVERSARMPTMIYRGVWKEGTAYAAGDTVTRDGSTWLAKADTASMPGAADATDWQLSVKKGRDGRDGLKGDKGERGAEGKAARELPVRYGEGGHRAP